MRPFLMKIDIVGLPETRVSTILKAIISDRDKFYEYLRFLLADEFDKGGGDGGDYPRDRAIARETPGVDPGGCIARARQFGRNSGGRGGACDRDQHDDLRGTRAGRAG